MKYNKIDNCIVIPEQRVYSTRNSVILNNKGEYDVVHSSTPKVGEQWLTIKLPSSHSFREGQMVKCGGRRGISIVRFSRFQDNPVSDVYIARGVTPWASRLPYQEDLPDIPKGEYVLSLKGPNLAKLSMRVLYSN